MKSKLNLKNLFIILCLTVMESFQLDEGHWPSEVNLKFRTPDQQKSKPALHDEGGIVLKILILF